MKRIVIFILFIGIYANLSAQKIIVTKGYISNYDTIHKMPVWSYYIARIEHKKQIVPRYPFFMACPGIKYQATNKDYDNSGYDKGHLTDADDMRWDKDAEQQSFYLTNVAPQVPEFNRVIWRELENHVRESLIDSSFVLTGVYSLNYKRFIGNKVYIPDYYYKIIYNYYTQKLEIYSIQNVSGNDNYSKYSVSFENVKPYLTGFDINKYSFLK
jgi:endonuclease G